MKSSVSYPAPPVINVGFSLGWPEEILTVSSPAPASTVWNVAPEIESLPSPP